MMTSIAYDCSKLTPLKQNNFQYKPSQQQVISYAEEVLQLTLPQDKEFLYLAEQALKAPLPKDWEACQYFEGQSNFEGPNQSITEEESIIVYRNKKTKQVVYDHPLDSLYKQKTRQLKLMKNTAKYSQNISPIQEQMIQSSVLLLNKNNSRKQPDDSMNNSSNRMDSSGMENSRNDIRYSQPRNSEFIRNITEESLVYQDQIDQFQNLSMITVDHDLDDQQKIQKLPLQRNVFKTDLKNNQNDNSKHKNKTKIISNFAPIPTNNHQKNSVHQLNQKPKIIRPIYIPTEEQKQMKKLKEKQRKKLLNSQIEKVVQKMVFSKLLQLNNETMNRLNHKLKKSIIVKEMQQKMIIMQQFSSKEQNKIGPIKEKQSQIKRLQMQSKLMQEKLKQMTKIIQLQRNLSLNTALTY